MVLMLPVWAAIPPLSPAELKERADVIVVGRVKALDTRVVDFDDGKNKVFEVDVQVVRVEKGKIIGDLVLATCWKPLERPPGWVGHQGQNEIPPKGGFVRLYLRDAGEGAYEILEPNGWELVKI
jgi:hypothetical protein